MRPILHGDVVVAARSLLPLPVADRQDAMRELIEQAVIADIYRKRLGRAHPLWGNGSLMAAAMVRKMLPEPFLDDPEYCKCLMLVFGAVLNWRAAQMAIATGSNPDIRP